MILVLKTLKYLFISMLVAVLLLLGTLALVPSTPIGSGWLVSQLKALAGDSLQLGDTQGAISSGLVLYHLRYELAAGTLVLDQLELQWQPASLLSGRLQLDYLAVRGGEWLASENPPLQPASGQSDTFSWPALTLPMPVELQQLELSGWRGVEVAEGASLRASLAAKGNELQLASFSLSSDILNSDVSGKLALTPPYSMNLQASWGLALVNGESWAGEAHLFGNLDGMEIDNRVSGPVQLESSGSARLVDWQSGQAPELDQLRFDIQHSLAQYQLALAGGQLFARNAQLQASGHPNQVQLAMQADVEFDQHELATFGQLNLQASLQQMHSLQISRLQLDSGRGQVQAEGQLSWQDGLSWQARIRASNLSLVDLVSQLDAELEVVGSFDTEWALTTTIENINIGLEGVQWQISGQASVQDDRVSFSGLSADSGAQQILLDGQVWPQPDFSFQATANSVSNLMPGLQAQVQGQGSIAGQWINPRGDATLKIRQLSTDALDLQSADLRLIPLEGEQQYQLELQLGAFSQAGQLRFLALGLGGQVNPQQANLGLTAELPLGRLESDLQLQYPQLLQGQPENLQLELELQSLSFVSDSDLPGFQLESTARATLARNQQQLMSSCIKLNGGGRVCLEGQHSPSQQGSSLQASFRVRALPTALANPWLPPDLQWQGTLDGDASLMHAPGQPLQLEASLTGEQGLLQLRQLGEGEEPLVYRNLQASVQADGPQWSASASALLPGESLLQAQARYHSETDEVSATADLLLHRLHWLEGVSTRVEEPDGRAELRLDLGGTLQQPQIELYAELSELRGIVVDSGVQISNSWVRLQPENGDNGRYLLAGRLNTGEGGVDIQGQFGLADLNKPSAVLSIDGEQLLLFDRPDLSGWINPQLQFEWKDGQGRLDGTIEMPRANLQMPKVGGTALRRSGDEIIIGQANDDSEAAPRISGRVQLVIGEDVRLSGQGLDTGLSGALDAEYNAEGELALYGTLTIGDGEYGAYDRTLNIESGSLTFSGEAGNPGIIIRAVQSYPEYQVGIQITGTAQNPVTELFSTPVMPQTDILAILVTGRSLDRIGEGEAPSLLDAIDSLGIVGGESLTGRIESAFGLSEFRITDEEEGNSVVAGTYLLPRLYVELVQSLFDRTSKLGLEYLVNDNLRLRAQTGDAQSMELIYVIERP